MPFSCKKQRIIEQVHISILRRSSWFIKTIHELTKLARTTTKYIEKNDLTCFISAKSGVYVSIYIYIYIFFFIVLSKVRSSDWEGIEKIQLKKINWLLQLNYRSNAPATKHFMSEAQPQPQPVNLPNQCKTVLQLPSLFFIVIDVNAHRFWCVNSKGIFNFFF